MDTDKQGDIGRYISDTMNDILWIEENNYLGRPKGVSGYDLYILEALVALTENGATEFSELQARLRVSTDALTQRVDLLQRKGFITKFPDKDNKKLIRLSLADAGRKVIAEQSVFRSEMTNELLSELNPAQTEALLNALGGVRSFLAKKENKSRRYRVKIIADSTCDILPEEAKELGITLIPMHFLFGDSSYRQNVDISAENFYKKLVESKISPTTVQLTPFDLEQIYRESVKDGSEAVAIHLSSALSGTYQSAVIASSSVKGVYVPDAQNATFGLGLLVRIACKLRDEGRTALEISENIAELSKRVRLYAYIDSLKYLVRGGRVSAAAGIVGGVLDIHPIISVIDGAVQNVGKAKGKKGAIRELMHLAKRDSVDKRYPVVFGHAADFPSLSEFKESVNSFVSSSESYTSIIGGVIGSHVGPGAIGFAFIAS